MKTYLKIYRDTDWGAVGGDALTGATTGLAFGPIGAAVGGLVGAGIGLFAGGSQKKQGKQLLAANQFQPNQVPQAELDNQQLAKQQASEGLPSQQYQLAMKNIQRSQATALRSAQDRRSGNALIPAIQQNSSDQQAQLDSRNAMARLQGQQRLIGVNSQVAGYQNNAWQQNNRNRLMQYNYGQQLIGAGNENIIHGVDSGVAALMRGGAGLFGGGNNGGNNSNLFNNIDSRSFNNPGITSPDTSAGSLGQINPSGNSLDLTYNQ